jgi:threonine/homoserine/homoserine lactone efflux protein
LTNIRKHVKFPIIGVVNRILDGKLGLRPEIMQPFSALLWGTATGMAIVAPFGPLKLLCLRRTFAFGPKAGVVTAAGVVSGDAIYVAIAFLGLSAIATALIAVTPWLKLTAAAVLLVLAFGIFRQPMPEASALSAPRTLNYPTMYLGTVLLTLANPMTIVMFGAVLLGAGGAEVLAAGPSGLFASMGILLGSILVWSAFTALASFAGRHMSVEKLRWANIGGAAALCWFAFDAARSGLAALSGS